MDRNYDGPQGHDPGKRAWFLEPGKVVNRGFLSTLEGGVARNVQVKSGIAICIVGSAMFISGCGDDNVANGPSGRLTQGPVGGAVIFADEVSSGTRFVRDDGEIQTTTDATTGIFTLPSEPGYAYILVSVGGTDQLTNQPAMQLIAPSGSANVTPLTTLVALDTTGLVKAKIEALGTSFDVDISQN